MTETSVIKADNDAFWGRVRAALGGLRVVRRTQGEPAYGTAAIARSLGMRTRLGARIDEVLHLSWRQCALAQVSLSLIVIEIDRFKELHSAYDRETIERAMARVGEAIQGCLKRPADECLRYGRSGFVVVLPDYPLLMARQLAGTLVREVAELGIAHKESHAGVMTASIGLVAGNPEGAFERTFFETAAEALLRAQRYGLGRIETIDLRPGQLEKRKAG